LIFYIFKLDKGFVWLFQSLVIINPQSIKLNLALQEFFNSQSMFLKHY